MVSLVLVRPSTYWAVFSSFVIAQAAGPSLPNSNGAPHGNGIGGVLASTD